MCVQNDMSLNNRVYEGDIAEAAHQFGVVGLPYGALSGGVLTGEYLALTLSTLTLTLTLTLIANSDPDPNPNPNPNPNQASTSTAHCSRTRADRSRWAGCA